MDKQNEAVQLFEEGYMCSQAVFAVFATDFGVSKEEAECVKAKYAVHAQAL